MSDDQTIHHTCYTPNTQWCVAGWPASFDELTGRKVIVICRCACHMDEPSYAALYGKDTDGPS